jgi:hypothetical protein
MSTVADEEELDDYWDDEEDEPPLVLWECFQGPPDEEECDPEELEQWLEGLICRRVWRLFHEKPAIRSERVSPAESKAPGYAEKDDWFWARPEVDVPKGESWYDLCGAVERMVVMAADELHERIWSQVEGWREKGFRVFVRVSSVRGSVHTGRFLREDYLGLDVGLDVHIRLVERDALDRILGDREVRAVDQDPFGQYVAYNDDDY